MSGVNYSIPETLKIDPQTLSILRFRSLLINALPAVGFVVACLLVLKQGISSFHINLFILFYALTFIGIEVGFHRYFSHGSFQTTVWLEHVLATLGCWGGQGPVLYWAASHRRHHKHADTEQDPHSPHFSPGRRDGPLARFLHSHMNWIFSKEISNPLFYTRDLVAKNRLSRYSNNYLMIVLSGILLPGLIALICLYSFSEAALAVLYAGVARLFLVQQVTFCINSVCHLLGDRPNNTNDFSTNNVVLAIPSMGGAWHNNHHASPSSAYIDFRWWQIDIGGYFIRLLAVLGLAWNIKEKPKIHSLRSLSSP